MATRIPTTSEINVDNSLVSVTWTGLLNGDDGTPISAAEFADRSIHFFGTFGVGGTIILEGSNEAVPTNWAPLADPQGTAISKTQLSVEQLLELTRWVRPRVTAGDGTTSLSAVMLIRRANSLRT